MMRCGFAAGNSQFEINAILIREARAGKHVVLWSPATLTLAAMKLRFGRQGVAVEIVPGIAASTAKVFPFMSREDIANEILRAAS